MAFIEVFCLLATVCALAYYYITKDHNYWKKRGIAYEKPIPIFGNVLDSMTMKRNIGMVITDVYRQHEGESVVGMFNFTKPVILIRDPELVNKVLVTNFNDFANNSVEINADVDPIIARNIFVQRGETWKRSRQAMSPAFTVGKIKSTFDTIKNIVDQLMKYIEKHPEVEAKDALSLFTSEIVAGWGIGIDGHSFSVPDPILPKLGKLIFEPSAVTAIKFMLVLLSPGIGKLLRLKIVPDEVPEFFDGMLRDIIKQRELSSESRKDFLQYYIDLRKKRLISKNDDQNDVSEDDIVAGVVSFFIEGYETSSIIGAFILFYLVNKPSLQSDLREEINDLFQKSNGEPSLEGILDLRLLNNIFSETLRLHGAFNMSKQTTRDVDLDLGNGKSLRLDKGTDVWIPIFGLHTDPKYWEKPDEFDTNRFTEENKASRTKGVYLPFGDGPRSCIGMRIAYAMIKTAVVYLVRNFEILPTEKTPKEYVQDPKHFLTFQKGGIHLKFKKINNKL